MSVLLSGAEQLKPPVVVSASAVLTLHRIAEVALRSTTQGTTGDIIKATLTSGFRKPGHHLAYCSEFLPLRARAPPVTDRLSMRMVGPCSSDQWKHRDLGDVSLCAGIQRAALPQVYVECRQHMLEQTLEPSGVNPGAREEIARMPWEQLEKKIQGCLTPYYCFYCNPGQPRRLRGWGAIRWTRSSAFACVQVDRARPRTDKNVASGKGVVQLDFLGTI